MKLRREGPELLGSLYPLKIGGAQALNEGKQRIPDFNRPALPLDWIRYRGGKGVPIEAPPLV